jgi:hypothetical protein
MVGLSNAFDFALQLGRDTETMRPIMRETRPLFILKEKREELSLYVYIMCNVHLDR